MNGRAADIGVSVADGIATVTLDRPERRNAVTLGMWREIGRLFQGFATEEAVRAVILTGAGGNFCAGADIAEFGEKRRDADDGAVYDDAVAVCTTAITDLPKPTIAVIQGFCIGGGAALALACDFRFADAGARFAIPAARLGIVYGRRETETLLALVGLGAAKRILFGGERFDAGEALRIGFIDRIAEDAAAEARLYAAGLGGNAPLSIAGAKLILNGLVHGCGSSGSGPQIGAEADAVAAAIRRALDSADYIEGRRAFAEKRPPRFTGA